MYDYIDIHSHLNFPEFDGDREEIIEKLKEEKIATITVGTYLETSKESVELAEKHENIFATIGVHPADLSPEALAKGDKAGEMFDEKEFEKLVTHKKVVAIGECGLDYARLSNFPDEDKEKKRQKEIFVQQIEFAVKHDKPLMIHCRPAPQSLGVVGDAYPDALEILKSKQKEFGEKVRGNFHFFTSPIGVAKQCLELGFTVSFTGPITFAKQYEDLVKYVPIESMMAETDSPYAAPVPYRGKRNNPLYIKEIVEAIARIKGLPLDTVRQSLVKNVFELFLRNSLSEVG